MFQSGQNSYLCPTTVQLWKDQAETYNCIGSKYYHCLPDKDGNAYQSCLDRKTIWPGSCPIYDSQQKKIEFVFCEPSLGSCPNAAFWSDSAYEHPGCLNMFNVQDVTEKIVIDHTRGEEGKDNTGTLVAIIIPCVVLVLVLLLVVIAFVIKKRRLCARNGGQGETRELSVHSPTKSNAKDPHDGGEGGANEPLVPAQSSNTGARNGGQGETSEPSVHLPPESNAIDALDGGVGGANEPLVPAQLSSTAMAPVMNEESQQRGKSTKQIISDAIDKNLMEKGSRLLLIGDYIEQGIKSELEEREPNFEVIKCVDHWFNNENIKDYVLMTCFLNEGCITSASTTKDLREKVQQIHHDIQHRGLRVVIPMGKIAYENNKAKLRSISFFDGLEPVYI